MARVTYGSEVTELAGSIGGVTFLRNASGPIAKLRSNPPVNPSPLQSTYQVNMARLVAYWPTLSQEDKTTWDDFAAAHVHTTPWGDDKTLSGYQWFISCNLTRLFGSYAILDTAPIWSVIDPPTQFTIQVSSTYIRLHWDPAQAKSLFMYLYVTLPLRQSSIKLRRSLFYIRYLAWNGTVTDWDFTAKYESLVGITWADFYASADCSIIARVKRVHISKGLSSFYTSAIVKIG
ncbi:hypothetical protein ES705_49809 [subsurface metagenome]